MSQLMPMFRTFALNIKGIAIASASAALHFSGGAKAKHDVMIKAGIGVGIYTKHGNTATLATMATPMTLSRICSKSDHSANHISYAWKVKAIFLEFYAKKVCGADSSPQLIMQNSEDIIIHHYLTLVRQNL